MSELDFVVSHDAEQGLRSEWSTAVISSAVLQHAVFCLSLFLSALCYAVRPVCGSIITSWS